LLFLVSGSSGSGKSAVGRVLVERLPELVLLDFDDVPRPADPTPARWNALLEKLVGRAVELQAGGRDSLLLGWTPLSELRRAPSSGRLDGIAACLLDCDDATREQRLERRAREGWPRPSRDELAEYIRFAAWLRDDYAGRDTLVLDTSELTIERTADLLEHWITNRRATRTSP
jgi:RNase adaptor protein for sRNA GlmZ degradation